MSCSNVALRRDVRRQDLSDLESSRAALTLKP